MKSVNILRASAVTAVFNLTMTACDAPHLSQHSRIYDRPAVNHGISESSTESDKFYYLRISILTSNEENSGTNAAVYLRAHYDVMSDMCNPQPDDTYPGVPPGPHREPPCLRPGTAGLFRLSDPRVNDFERGSYGTYSTYGFKDPAAITDPDIKSIDLCHDNSGEKPGWKISDVWLTLLGGVTEPILHTYQAHPNRWIAKDRITDGQPHLIWYRYYPPEGGAPKDLLCLNVALQ